jgi:hypothetical protein
VFITFIDDHTVSFRGSDPGAGIAFDIVFDRLLPGIAPLTVPVGDRFFDVMRYYPVMPSATVHGKFSIGGLEYQVTKAIGYHDHLHGTPTRIGWAPWICINTPDFEIIAVIIPSRRDILLSCLDKATWVRCGRPSSRIVQSATDSPTGLVYPKIIDVSCMSKSWKGAFRLEERGPHAMIDIGLAGYSCPVMWSWNYRATGTVAQQHGRGEKLVKNFKDVPTAMYYMTMFDLKEFDKVVNASSKSEE